MKKKINELLTGLTKNEVLLLIEELDSLTSDLVSVETKFGKLHFYVHSQLLYDRVEYFYTDEPEIFDWIDTFDKDDTIWDIGANVGTYCCYLALKGHEIKAFEPISYNYNLLNKNIKLNKLNNIEAYCLAFNDTTKLDNIYMKFDKVGWGCNNFGDKIDWNGKDEFNAKNQETVVGYSIDDFIEKFNLLVPNHIKIDVDGIEHKIINGMKTTLKNKNLKSIYIELTDTNEFHQEAIKVLNNFGFSVLRKDNGAQHHSSIWDDTYNYVFKRNIR